MLELTKQTVFVKNVNPRAEKHGKDTKLAFDVFFSLDVSNDVLSLFDPALKETLFKKGDSPQGELLTDQSRLSALRFPRIGKVDWDEEFPGYTLTLHVGINDESHILLSDAKLDRFSFDPKEGGAVTMGFRGIVHPVLSKDIATICELIQRDVEISLTPPAPSQELNSPEQDLSVQVNDYVSTADAAANAIDADEIRDDNDHEHGEEE